MKSSRNVVGQKEECKKFGIQFLDGLKEGIKLIIFKWKNGEKKEDN